MKAISRIQVGVIALVVSLAASLPSTAAVIWSDNFNDNVKTDWIDYVAGPDLGYFETGMQFTRGWDGSNLNSAESVKNIAIGALGYYEVSADVEAPQIAGESNSRTGITFGRADTASGTPFYLLAMQSWDHIELLEGTLTGGLTTLANGPIGTPPLFDSFHNLKAVVETVNAGTQVRIRGYLDGVQQFDFTDSAANSLFGQYAGVFSTFASPSSRWDNYLVAVADVPEPASASLLVIGFGLVALRKRRAGRSSIRS